MNAGDAAARVTAAVEGEEDRETRARRGAVAIREAGSFAWVGFFDVDDDRFSLIGHTGPQAPVHVTFPVGEGLNGTAVSARAGVVSDDGTEMVVPVLAPDTGVAMGTLDVRSDRPGAFGDAGRALIERCAIAAIALFE